MFSNPPTMEIPVQTDDKGVIRVSGTRVSLDSILNNYLQGDSPEVLHDSFPTVPLTDIYAVIAYYLAHQTELNTYLKRQKSELVRIRHEVETKYPPKVTRKELLERINNKKNG